MGKTYRGGNRDKAKKAAARRRKEARLGYSRKDFKRNRNWQEADE